MSSQPVDTIINTMTDFYDYEQAGTSPSQYSAACRCLNNNRDHARSANARKSRRRTRPVHAEEQLCAYYNTQINGTYSNQTMQAHITSNGFTLSHSMPFNGASIINDDEGFEATFAIQGIVHSTILPPFYHLSRSV